MSEATKPLAQPALGRQLPSEEARARRPAEFTSIRIDLEGKVDNDSGIRSNNPSRFSNYRLSPSSICSDACQSRFPFDSKRINHCISGNSKRKDPRSGGKQFDLELTCEKQFAGEMFGKRGEKPPLPCNCKRPFFDCTSHCPSRVGRRSHPEVGRESGDRSRQAHSPLFLGRRRTLNVYSDAASFSNTSVLRASDHVVCVFCKGSIQLQPPWKSGRPAGQCCSKCKNRAPAR